MEFTVILAIVNGLIASAFNLYKILKQIKGEQELPSWNDLLKANKELQDEIDAEG